METAARQFPFIPKDGDCADHPFPPAEMTDYTFVDNGSFKGYRVGLQRICPVCHFVSQTVKGVATDELKGLPRAEFRVEHDGTKTPIDWNTGAAQPPQK